MPSVFRISEDGKSLAVRSHVKNLHLVKHKSLYEPIEHFFAKSVPGANAHLLSYASPEIILLDLFSHPGGTYSKSNADLYDQGSVLFIYVVNIENREPELESIEWKGLQTDGVYYRVNDHKFKVITSSLLLKNLITNVKVGMLEDLF